MHMFHRILFGRNRDATKAMRMNESVRLLHEQSNEMFIQELTPETLIINLAACADLMLCIHSLSELQNETDIRRFSDAMTWQGRYMNELNRRYNR